MRAGVAAVDAVIFIYKRLMSMLLRPQRTRHILRAFHDISALIVPDNAFADGAEKEAFVRFLEERIAAAKAAKPAEADGQDESN